MLDVGSRPLIPAPPDGAIVGCCVGCHAWVHAGPCGAKL